MEWFVKAFLGLIVFAIFVTVALPILIAIIKWLSVIVVTFIIIVVLLRLLGRRCGRRGTTHHHYHYR